MKACRRSTIVYVPVGVDYTKIVCVYHTISCTCTYQFLGLPEFSKRIFALLHLTQPTSRQFQQFRQNAEVQAQRLSEALRQARSATSRTDTSKARDTTDQLTSPPLDTGMRSICSCALVLRLCHECLRSRLVGNRLVSRHLK